MLAARKRTRTAVENGIARLPSQPAADLTRLHGEQFCDPAGRTEPGKRLTNVHRADYPPTVRKSHQRARQTPWRASGEYSERVRYGAECDGSRRHGVVRAESRRSAMGRGGTDRFGRGHDGAVRRGMDREATVWFEATG
jgi:hypothetical protein